MKLTPGSERIIAGDDTDPLDGNVRWAPAKSLWIGAMTAVALALGPPLFSWDALILLVVTSALTLCFGHSVGMHRLAGLISMGESWHNNHHAFPGSARMGLFPGQIDLGWWLIKGFEAARLATHIKTPADLPRRPGLRRLVDSENGNSAALRTYPEQSR